MQELVRFGVSMEADLRDRFDRYTETKGFANRSEAMRRLVQDALRENVERTPDGRVAGTVTLVYPTGRRLPSVPTAEYPSLEILSNLQVHVSDTTLMKIIVVRGRYRDVSAWSEQLLGVRGMQGRFTVAALDDTVTSEV